MIVDWMLYCSAVGVCAAVAATAAEPLMRLRHATGRSVWIGALLSMVLVPVGVAMRPRASVALSGEPSLAVAATEPESATTSPATRFGVPAMLAIAWIASSSLMFLGIGVAAARIARARRGAVWTERDGTTIAITEVLGPGAVSFGQPRVIVPRWFSQLGDADQRLLVLHESEHVRRRDPEWLVGGAIIVALQPWNPAAWWAVSRLRRAIELDCDARVLARYPDVRRYGALLIDVARRASGPTVSSMLSFAPFASRLRERIETMTAPRRRLSMAHAASLGTMVVIAFAAGCEARRPAPLAPVTDYVIEGGEARALPLSAAMPDSQRARAQAALGARIRAAAATLGPPTGDPAQPLVLVESAAGAVVYLGRMDGLGTLDPNLIERVEVLKGGTLPPEAPAGLIQIRLKDGATIPSRRGASSDHALAPPLAEAVSVAQRRPVVPSVSAIHEPEGAADSSRIGRAVDTSRPVRIILVDFVGAVLFDSVTVWSSEPDGERALVAHVGALVFGPYRVQEDEIARIQVRKAGATNGSTSIEVWLKEGVRPRTRRP